jgi:hypothetical protein
MILIQIGNLSSLSCPNNVFPEAEVRIMVFAKVNLILE